MNENWDGAKESMDDAAERRVLFSALDSFRQYRRLAHLNVTHHKRQDFYTLPAHHWQMLAGPPFNISSKFDQVDHAIDVNAEVAERILETGLVAFGVPEDPPKDEDNFRNTTTTGDVEKANTTLRQFLRDWSEEGAEERAAHFQPILDDLETLFKDKEDKGEVRVLVPGAGLGRLAFEICRAGYHTEGNEISFHALLASNWVLNTLQPEEKFDYYPAALNFTNQLSLKDQLNKISIPDVHPGQALELSSQGKKTHAFDRMNMSASDFTITYSDDEHRGRYDSVVTVFFIDTAPNVIRYIETIFNTLRDGGYWINLGPLKWHFAGGHEQSSSQRRNEEAPSAAKNMGIGAPGSVELTNDELLLLVQHMGFEIEIFEMRPDGQSYISEVASMSQHFYRVSHFIARKVVK
ncbi:MAG: hypothetical protein LQ340_005354 [Diploschistes diacapsis]|nr:MAG: hypothetical protein LQ340_005354 [Diploschistes diacapsis]